MKKESFLELISRLKPDEINKLIQEKGKPPKMINPIVVDK